jgi:tetratricopeptide (TPR) repeat protein
MPKINILKFFQRFYRLISSFILLVIFFYVYNVFLIDHTLESMRFSLEQATQAYSIEDLDGLDMLISGAVMEEIEPEAMDSISMANLEHAKGIVARGSNYRRIKNMKLSLSAAINKMEEERGFILTFLDMANKYIKKAVLTVSYLPQRHREARLIDVQKTGVGREDAEFFKKARDLELRAKLEEAAECYSDFINKYPKHEKIALIKLRAAYTYQKQGKDEKARSLYKNIIKTYPLMREADIARMQLYKLKQIAVARRNLTTLLIKASELPKEDKQARQKIYYKIAILHTKAYNVEEARKFYKRSFETNPTGDVAFKSRFNAAWLEKDIHNLKESTSEFLKLAEENAPEGLVVDARHQVANIYQQEGRYEDAIEIYTHIAEEYKDNTISSFCLFQAGASYMYDLNDQDKAEEVFKKLKKEYPESPYTEFTSMETPIGLFLTFIVPRAMRVVTWRESGLMALSGYSGKIIKFKVQMKEESFNKGFRDWCLSEFPDEIGNIKFNMKDTDFKFKKDKASVTGTIIMGKFDVEGEAEGYLKKTDEDSIRLVVTKAVLENIPIPAIFINMALSGIFIIIDKYFPIQVTDVYMHDGAMYVEGFSAERIMKSIAKITGNVFGADIAINQLRDPQKRDDLYNFYKKKFPWSSFLASSEEENIGESFYDFFTRMYLYGGFKLLETVKDSKLNYYRAIRTFGKLEIEKEKFKFTYTDTEINSAMNIFIVKEFPWLVGGEFMFDVKGLEFKFRGDGDIDFDGYMSIGRNVTFLKDASNIRVKGRMRFEIDKDSKIPYMVFEELTLNRRPFSVDRLNTLSLTCLNMLKDGNIPIEIEEIRVSEGQITLKGEGADDLTSRIFSEPHLFVIFYIRDWDLHIAGIQRIRPQDYKLGDRWIKHLQVSEIKTLLTETNSTTDTIEEEAEEILQGEQNQ